MLLQLNVRYKTRVAVKFTGIARVTSDPASRGDRSSGRGAPMRLYDTARREVVPFEPGPIVTMYTCGITPYDATHLGHAATYVTYDVLQRRLRDLGHETRCVRNITDVDDDILRKARELGVHYLDLAAAEMARFDDDMVALERAASVERAAGHLGHRRHPRLHRHGARPGPRLPGRRRGLLRRVARFPAFGPVSGYSPRARCSPSPHERGGNVDDPNKRDPLDFVLWQPSLEDEPAWESLWGPGRPGWHIECSALALRELDTTIDLHGGGADLIFPHHECEAAQSEAATGEPFVRHWMHQAMVRMDGEKMSKSLGNLVFVSDLLKKWDPMAIRLVIVEHHYRDSWEWDETLMPRAAERLERWRPRPAAPATAAARRGAGRASTTTSTRPAAVAAIDAAVGAGQGVVGRRRPARRRPSEPLQDSARRGRHRLSRARAARSASSTPSPSAVLTPIFKALVAVRGRGPRPRARHRAAPSSARTTSR